jgi:endonuclease/exonuclease/phosphatase family metal-dependent hydrolase
VKLRTLFAVAALVAAGCASQAERAPRATPGGQRTADSGQPGTRPAQPELALRVVSYNIRHGRGMDGEVDLERTAAVLRRLDPDIVGLQEVDDGVERSGRVRQHLLLGELLGMHAEFGSFMDYQGGRYGLALLSRHPVRDARMIRLTEGNEPRVGLAVTIDAPGAGPLTVLNVHFDWVAADSFRFVQATEAAQFLDTVDGPWIMLGDLNDEPGSRTVELFRGRAMEAAKPPGGNLTFSSTEPVKEIDYIFAAPAARWGATDVRVIPETLASDHRPVFAVMHYRLRP